MNNESWIHTHWRPSMGWLYMAICAFDFIIAPVLTIVMKANGISIDIWKPITLAEGGLIHLSFGAICGITAYGRTKEKCTLTSEGSIEQK